MKRLLSILLAVLLTSALSAQVQDCCKPTAPGHCHHTKSTRPEQPCGPAVSACPDSECLKVRKDVIAPSSNKQLAARALSLQPKSGRLQEVSLQHTAVWLDVMRTHRPVQLFLLNRALVI